MEEMVTIRLTEYEQLKEDSLVLLALNAAGVDNWGGYSYACEILEKLEKEE